MFWGRLCGGLDSHGGKVLGGRAYMGGEESMGVGGEEMSRWEIA